MATKPVLASSRITFDERTFGVSAWCTSLSMFAVDIVTLSCVYWLAVIGRNLITPGSFRFYVELFPGIALFLWAFSIQGLYPGVLLHPAEELRRVFHCVSIVVLLVLCTAFLWHNAQSYSRAIVMLIWAIGAPAVLFARHASRNLLARFEWWGVPAVVFGSGIATQRVVRTLRDRRLGVRVTAVVADSRTNLPDSRGHYAIVTMLEQPDAALQQLIRDCCKGYRHVLLVPDLPGICSLGISTREIGGEIGFEVPQRLFQPGVRAMKRSLDLLLGVLLLLLLTPLFLVIAAVIKLASPGPVFYGHRRYGRGEGTFNALKFRTMFQNGDEILLDHLRKFPEELISWQRDQKLKNDPRITSVGRILRRYSLDEIPQLFNVLGGQMSLVGPRPIVQSEIAKYGVGYCLYTRVSPGLTGLWQVSGRNNTTYEERVAYDEYYVRNWSIWLDAYILTRTVSAVLRAEGAY